MNRLFLVLLFLVEWWSIAPCEALAKRIKLREDDEREDDNFNRSSSSAHRIPGASNSPLKFKSDPSSLSSRAFELSGDSTFARQLQEEAKKESATGTATGTGSASSSPSPTTSIVLEHHPLVYVGILAVMGASLATQGSLAMLQETLVGVTSTLAIAWIPHWMLRASWVEVLSISTIFLRPTLRYYIQTEILPIMSSTFRKIVFGEAWRQLWLLLLAPLPKTLLVPRSKDAYKLLPRWMQAGITNLNKYVDRVAQQLIKKATEKSVHETFGGLFSSVTDSILELSIFYEDGVSDDTADVEVETAGTDGLLEDDNDACEGGVCQI